MELHHCVIANRHLCHLFYIDIHIQPSWMKYNSSVVMFDFQVYVVVLFLLGLNGQLLVKSPGVPSGIAQYDVASRCSLISFRRQEKVELIMKLLHQGAYTVIIPLLQPYLPAIKQIFVRLVKILSVKDRDVGKINACESVDGLCEYMQVPEKWDDTTYLRSMLNALPFEKYRSPSAVLHHYEQHLLDYDSILAAKRRLQQSRQSSNDPSSGNPVEVGITVKPEIWDLTYRGCHEMWRAVLVTGAGIPSDEVKWGRIKPSQSTTVCFHIPKEYASRITGCMLKGHFLWMLLELRVIKVQITGIACFWITWNSCNHLIKDVLLTGGDLFRFTKVITCAYFIKYYYVYSYIL